jgi:PTS system lactose-specific IIA component
MDRKEINMLGMEIVAYAGEARTMLLNAIKEAQKGNKEKSENLIKEAKDSLNKAHSVHGKLLADEAKGELGEMGLIMIHGQDHLMTTILLIDIVEHLCNIYYEK